MDKNMRICPFCGEEILISETKCPYCREYSLPRQKDEDTEPEKKICPYCKEEILATAIKCQHCGEFLGENGEDRSQKNSNTTKIFIVAFSLLIFVGLIVGGIFIAQNISSNQNVLTNTGYKSISINYKHRDNGFDIFNGVAQEEKDLLEFFGKSESKEDNTRLFEIFFDNLGEYKADFYNIFDYSKSLENDYGIKLSHVLTDANTEPVRILEPKVDVFYFDFVGHVALLYDEEYILKTYCPYINSEWQEYFQLSLQETKDFAYAEYIDDGVTKIKTYAKWAKKWDDFVVNYPNFRLNSGIKTQIYEYNNIVKNYYR